MTNWQKVPFGMLFADAEVKNKNLLDKQDKQ